MSPLRLGKQLFLTENLKKPKIAKNLRKFNSEVFPIIRIEPKTLTGALYARKTFRLCQNLMEVLALKSRKKSMQKKTQSETPLVFSLPSRA